MDYSQAQRLAHAEEFAETMTSRVPHWDTLLPEVQNAQRKHFQQMANQFEQGCEVHFHCSAMRLKKNHGLIPKDLHSTFDALLAKMLKDDTTLADYQIIVDELRRDFPNIRRWTDWWIRQDVARMVFPCVRDTNVESHAHEVPRTSNAVENQHSLLHHATGRHHDLIAGIQNLFLHIQELKLQYAAVQG